MQTFLWTLLWALLSTSTYAFYPGLDISSDAPLAAFDSWPKKIRRHIFEKGPHAHAEIKGLSSKRQSLDYQVTGLHEKSCGIGLSRISQYARYKEWVSLIKESRYQNERQEVFFRLKHTLLPFSMILRFQLPPIREAGDYPFRFEEGFLAGLFGQIGVRERKVAGVTRCLISLKANWRGPHSGIPSTAFAFFARALGILTIEKLFKISRTR